MHEQSLMKNLIEKIESIAGQQKAKKVVAVKVWLGALSHISGPHFIGHFDEAARGTVAEGARVDIEVSSDTAHPRAGDILLDSLEVED